MCLYLFSIVAPDSVTIDVEAGFIKWLGYTTVQIIYFDDEAMSSGQANNFLTAAELSYGITVAWKAAIRTSGAGGASMSDENIAKARHFSAVAFASQGCTV